MQIDPGKTYELHRPKELGNESTEAQVRQLLSKEQFADWQKVRDRAGTAGPLMIGGSVTRMPGDKANELFTKALIGGANPCYVDEETGQIHMGEYVLVPHPEGD